MLLRNTVRSEGLTNGTLLILKEINTRTLICEIRSENPDFNGKIHIIHRIWCTLDKGKFPFNFR